MERKSIFDKVIPPASALAFIVKKGQYFRIIDLEGKQVGDMVLFNEPDHTEKLSASYTRSGPGAAKLESPMWWITCQGITTGHKLLSTIRNPMVTITADTQVPGGIHDFVLRLCSSINYERTGFGPRGGCLELLTKVLEPYGIAPGNIPDPMNVFMNVLYDSGKGMFRVDEPVTRPGDYVEFRAEMDCLVGLTACPENVFSFCNGRPPHAQKPLKVQLSEE